MSAFIIARISVRDPDRMKEYAAAAAPVVADHGGEFLLRGALCETLLGDGAPGAAAVIRFPDTGAAKAWFASDAYQALTEMRIAAADIEFQLYETA